MTPQKLLIKIEGLKRKRKPTHGTCCTCQECGYDNDQYCECKRNHIIDEVIDLIKQTGL